MKVNGFFKKPVVIRTDPEVSIQHCRERLVLLFPLRRGRLTGLYLWLKRSGGTGLAQPAVALAPTDRNQTVAQTFGSSRALHRSQSGQRRTWDRHARRESRNRARRLRQYPTLGKQCPPLGPGHPRLLS